MKIAFVSQPWNRVVPPFDSGSIVNWTHEVARRLAKSHQVIIYATKFSGAEKVEWCDGVQYRRFSAVFDKRLDRYRDLFSRLFDKMHLFFASRLYYFSYMTRIAKDLRDQKCDIIHIHNFSQFVTIARKFNPEIKIALHMHCEWLNQLDRSMIQKRLKHVDLIIGVSKYITSKIQRRFPELGGRCKTVFNGVDADIFRGDNEVVREKNGNVRLLYVGRVSPEKGVHVLLEAFQRVTALYPKVQLDIIGPRGSARIEFIMPSKDEPVICDLTPFYQGSYQLQLDNKVSAEYGDRVSFLGRVPHSELVRHLQNSDVFFHPSIWGEPFPLAVLEAMAAGVPVVASRAGGLVESIEDGETGLLVEPCNATALAEAIIFLLKNADTRKKMGEAARKRAAGLFSWEQTAESLLRGYKNIR